MILSLVNICIKKNCQEELPYKRKPSVRCNKYAILVIKEGEIITCGLILL